MPVQPATSSEPIPGYCVTKRIGAGGYGEVWKADAPGGLAKAIKFVYGFLDDERAARELKALNRIKEVRHPFLLSLERIEVVDGQLIIVTELADASLKDVFEQWRHSGSSGIPRDELLGYIGDAADALDYMSEKFSLQHLDIKPENLLIVGGRVKVADFGLVKDIHDVSVSLMGGLTPLYAPPEVYDSRPSRHSDQYSLAIVYQEMLTGQLPFPGRTPAQLAAQHISGKPRLSTLSPSDRRVIAKALAKQPEQRFESCRELADALRSGGQHLAATGAGASEDHGAANEDTRSGLSVSTEAASEMAATAVPTLNSDELAPPRNPTQVGGTLVRPPTAAGEVEILPPVELAADQLKLQPAVVVGVGGTATMALEAYRRHIRDQFGSLAAVPSTRVMLLDTDVKGLYNSVQADDEARAGGVDVLPLPLRRTSEYRADSKKYLQWLSRRWLYNIPRSMQTEGLRPLGRLAFADHSKQILAHLRDAVTSVTQPDVAAKVAETTGLQLEGPPRVFIVSSVSGGAGSGMVLDVAAAAHTVLEELGHDPRVYGLLAHSTPRQSGLRELALANSYAFLAELAHFTHAGRYPGDSGCRLPAIVADKAPFNDVYFVHLGDGLDEAQFATAVGGMAEFLFRDTLTSAGALLEQCRSADGAEPSRTARLRTFGISSVGCSQGQTREEAIRLLCEMLVGRWCGEAPTMRSMLTTAKPVRLATASELDHMASECAKTLQLDLENLHGRISELVAEQLGGQPERHFQKLMTKSFVRDTVEGAGGISTEIDAAFSADETEVAGVLPLLSAVNQELQGLADERGTSIRKWILGLVDFARCPAARRNSRCRVVRERLLFARRRRRQPPAPPAGATPRGPRRHRRMLGEPQRQGPPRP